MYVFEYIDDKDEPDQYFGINIKVVYMDELQVTGQTQLICTQLLPTENMIKNEMPRIRLKKPVKPYNTMYLGCGPVQVDDKTKWYAWNGRTTKYDII